MTEEERNELLQEMMDQYEEDFKDGKDDFKVEEKVDEEMAKKDYESFQAWANIVKEEYEAMKEEEKAFKEGKSSTSKDAFTRSYSDTTKERKSYAGGYTGSYSTTEEKEKEKETSSSSSRRYGYGSYYESIYGEKKKEEPKKKSNVALDKEFEEAEDKKLSEEIRIRMEKLGKTYLNRFQEENEDWDMLDLQFELDRKNRRRRRYNKTPEWDKEIEEIEELSKKIDNIIFKCETLNVVKINPYTVE